MTTNWHDEQDSKNIRVLRGPEAAERRYLETQADEQAGPPRTPGQLLQDQLFDIASTGVAQAIEGREIAFDALVRVTEIPAKLRGLETLLRQLQAFVDAERARKG